ncbi:hypothetical protein O181_011942 [Austropuccinia psidii MF-1]|uniref:Uncharacterized protein n=1 Tax=Austropuccinia psidii MF-1 TaxID=1389203 RepID=A0A9Q3GMJ5_9BASI|nr:hypothetical protein [Austropuccinia psidii MF-1]
MKTQYLERSVNGGLHQSFNIDKLFDMQDNDFKQGMRTSKEGFHFLYEKIHHHRVFSNNSTAVQLPIAHQLAVTLERLGSNGNAGSVGKFARN